MNGLNLGPEAAKAFEALSNHKGEIPITSEDNQHQLDPADSEGSSSDTDSFFKTEPTTEESEKSEGEENPEVKAPSKEAATKTAKPGSKPAPKAEDVDYVLADGKKIKVDFSNRDAIKKAISMAAGARKWQAAKDKSDKEAAEVKTQLAAVKATMDKLEEAWKTGGEDGVVRLLSGGQRGLKEAFKEQSEREAQRAKMTPAQLEAEQYREQLDAIKRENEQLRGDVKKQLDESKSNQDKADIRNMEAKAHPAFDRYRFAGKLGDEALEHQLDEAIWDQSLRRLEKYPEDVELTNEMVEKEFRAVANTFRKVATVQADQRTKQVLTQKKADAKSQAQTLVSSKSGSPSSVEQEARDLVKNRDLTSILTNWGKFGKVFNR